MTIHLTSYHHVHLRGSREIVREAVNWCFDNCSEGWSLERMDDPQPDTDGWASIQVEFEADRDAVLFKTFWNDR